MSFPASPDHLTQAWLSSALGYPVTGFEVEFFGEGAGIIGQVTRVHLESEAGPPSIIQARSTRSRNDSERPASRIPAKVSLNASMACFPSRDS